MRKQLLILLILNIAFHNNINAQNYRWAKSIGGKGSDGGQTIKTDASGNVYILGAFHDTVDFDTGPGIATLISTHTTSSSSGDIFILKLDSLGNFIWAKNIGAASIHISPNSMALDSINSIYVTGTFDGTFDSDPGPGVANLTAGGTGWNTFVLKLDSNGQYSWAKSLGNWGCSILSQCITTDSFGNLIFTGGFGANSGSGLDFDPDLGVSTLTTSASHNIFICKWNTGGNFVWAKGFIAPTNSSAGGYGNSIVADINGNIYIAGDFGNSGNYKVDFDPGPGVFYLNHSGNSDVFISKLDASGNLVWAKSMGGNDDDGATDIKLDSLGNVYTTGNFRGIADFNPGPGTNSFTAVGDADVFVSKINSTGNYLWCKTFGGIGPEYSNALIVNKIGNVYSTGGFSNTVDFDPGTSVNTLTCTGWWDMFISALDSSGNYLWAKSVKGSDSTCFSVGTSILVDKDENIFTTGQYYKTVDLNPDFGVVSSTAIGNREAFILKLGKCNISLNVNPVVNICSGQNATVIAMGATNYTWTPGGQITSSLLINPGSPTAYTLNGTLDNSCQQTKTVNLSITVRPNPVSVLSNSNSVCTGTCNGIVNAISSLGSAPYSYSLNGFATTMPRTDLCQGLYTLYTYDSFGCNNFNIFSIECVDTTGTVNATDLAASNEKLNTVKIYPNPSHDKFILEFEGDFSVYIYNSFGQLISEKSDNSEKAAFDLQGFSKGIYTLEISTGNERLRKKIILD